jgi:hypothetical protein
MAIGTEEFTLTLNGKSNQQYKDILAPLGIELVFEEENPSGAVRELYQAVQENMEK